MDKEKLLPIKVMVYLAAAIIIAGLLFLIHHVGVTNGGITIITGAIAIACFCLVFISLGLIRELKKTLKE